ncbi:MAG: hypothetical protein QXR85_00965 [Candidatus Micrarchaeaceae archaeon]
MEDTDEEANRLAYLQAAYMQQYELISNEIETYTIAQESLLRNLELIEHIGSVENSKILSGNGGIMFNATTGKLDSVLVYVGAGYVVEKSLDEAKSFLQKLSRANEENINRLSAEKNRLEKMLIEVSHSADALQNRRQQ